MLLTILLFLFFVCLPPPRLHHHSDHNISCIFSYISVWLVEDTVTDARPAHLVALLGQIAEEQRSSRPNILFHVIYAIALEMGFVCPASTAPPSIVLPSASWAFSFNRKFISCIVASHDRLLPIALYNADLGSFRIRIELFQLAATGRQCILLARIIGDILCVTVHIERSPGAGGYSVALSIPRYVSMVAGRERQPWKCLRNLRELSERLRGELYGPMRNYLLSETVGHWPGLCGVPEELRRMIWRRLNVKSLQAASRTCSVVRREIVEFRRV